MIDDHGSPPMLSIGLSKPPKRKRRKVLKSDFPLNESYKPRAIQGLEGPEHMIASELPGGFPDDLAFRALAAYAFLRTMSRELRLSPFTPNVFLRALNLPFPSRLLGQVHVVLLRHLLVSQGYTYRPRGMSLTKKRKLDGFRCDLQAGDNLAYLDAYTWPLFYDDYVHLSADILYERLHGSTNHLDYRSLALHDGNADYVPSDSEEVDEDSVVKCIGTSASKIAPGRRLSFLTRRGRGGYACVQARPSQKLISPPRQPHPKKIKSDHWDSDSDASCQSVATRKEDINEEFKAPPNRGTGRRGRPRKYPPLPSMSTRQKSVQPSAFPTQAAARNRAFYASSCNSSQSLQPEESPGSTLVMQGTRADANDGVAAGTVHCPTPSGFFSQELPSLDISDESILNPSKAKSNTGQVLHKVRQSIRAPRSSTRVPVMTQLPRPGMPTKATHMPNKKRNLGQSVAETKVQAVKPKGILVSDDVADALDSFLSLGSDVASTKNCVEANTAFGESSRSGCNDTWKGSMNDGYWPQFDPLKKLRKGIPHHRLPLVDKIKVLEFLIDELLTLDYIAAEFTVREIKSSLSDQQFGSLPCKAELAELENDDECGICGFEGDLLCCDGCPASYHRRCIGMDEIRQLPEGVWLCPECHIKDPTGFGSLRGGRKEALDWFNLRDLYSVHRKANGSIAEGCDTSSNVCHTSSCDSVGPSFSNIGSDDSFMVIQGFLFRRRSCSSGLDLLNASRSGPPVILVKPGDFLPLLQQLGQDVVSNWPFVQIPMDSSKIWSDPITATGLRSISQYFSAEASYDPSKYRNLYGLAPLSQALDASVGANDRWLIAKDYENCCYHFDTRMLSCHLSEDASCDNDLSSALRFGTNIFSPYNMISGYIEKLESLLSRAGLLTEFWGHENKNARPGTWAQKVKSCRSINRLAKLLVTLVDAIHPLAFNEDWFQSQGARPGRSTRDDSTGDDKRAFRALPEAWSFDKEKAIKRWEQSLDCNVLSLLALDSKNLSSFVDGAPLRVRSTGRKRKGVKVAPSPVDTALKPTLTPLSMRNSVVVDVDRDSTSQGQSSQGKMSSQLDQEQIEDADTISLKVDYLGVVTTESTKCANPEDAARTLRSRKQPREGVEGGVGMDTTLNNVRNSKMKEIETLVALQVGKEINWPVCGRSFYDPIAYIPPSEMKRLGRNAGCVMAAYVTYSKAFEVGQGALCHIWRKRCLDCFSFESLLHLIRTLRSFLDDTSIFNCETASRRGGGNKAQIQKTIVGSMRDLANGELMYFVYHQGRHRGCWIPAGKVDPASYVLEHDKRRSRILAALKRKAQTEKVPHQAHASKCMAEGKDISAVREKEKCDSAPISNSKELSNSTSMSANVQERPTTASINLPTASRVPAPGKFTDAKRTSTGRPYTHTPVLNTGLNRDREIQKCRSELESTLRNHHAEISQILLRCMSSGIQVLPDQVMFALRSKTFALLRKANGRIAILCGPSMTDDRLKTLILDAEALARSKFEAKSAWSNGENTPRDGYQHGPPMHGQYLGSYKQIVDDTHASPPYAHSQPNNHHLGHSIAVGPAHHLQASQPQNCGPHVQLMNPGTPYQLPNQSSFPHDRIYPAGFQQSEAPFGDRRHELPAHSTFGLVPPQLPQGVNPQGFPQSQFRFPLHHHLYQHPPGQNLVHPQQPPLRQPRDFDPRAEFDLEPRPLEEMARLDPPQWT